MAEWEVEIKVRRNGRLVRKDSSGTCESAAFALYWASQDLSRWADDVGSTGEPEL